MIQTIHLKNFKTYLDSEVKFGDMALVIGGNGTGKSNLFDAIRFLSYVGAGIPVRDALEGHLGSGPTATSVAGIRGGGESACHFDTDSDTFELGVTLNVDGDEIFYAVAIDAKTYRVVAEELRSERHEGPYVFSTRPHTGTGLEQPPDAVTIDARYYMKRRGTNPKTSFSPNEFVLSQFKQRKAGSNRNEDVANTVRRELASISLLELRPEVLRQYSPLGRFELGEHGENFAAVMWRLEALADRESSTRDDGDEVEELIDDLSASDRLDAINAWLSELTPGPYRRATIQRSPTNDFIFALEFGDGDSDERRRLVNARLLSDGTLRFAALALAALGTPGRQTLVVEEIENGINPARLSLLVRMLEQTVEGGLGVQVVASTHSPSVLDYASEATRAHSVVIGWDVEGRSSRPVPVPSLPGYSDILESGLSLGELQSDGWLLTAAEA